MRLQSLAPRVAIAAALLAVLAFGGAGRAAVRDAVLNPVNPVLPSATIGKQYGVRFEVLVDGQRSGYGLFGCKLDTGRADLPTFDDCAKLPPGLQLRSVAGCTYEQGCLELDGTPTKLGTYFFRIAASDGVGGVIVRDYRLTVETKLSMLPEPGKLDDGQVGAAYRQNFIAEGGVPPYVYTASGLPLGFGLSKSGVLTGRPKRPGDYAIKITVKDANGATLRQSYSLFVEGGDGGQLALNANLGLTLGKSERTRGFIASVTIASVGTEATNPATLEISVRSSRSHELDLFARAAPTGRGLKCEKPRGSGTPTVHVTCRVPGLKQRSSLDVSWEGDTDELPDTKGELESYTFRLSASVTRGSQRDDPSDNAEGDTATTYTR